MICSLVWIVVNHPPLSRGSTPPFLEIHNYPTGPQTNIRAVLQPLPPPLAGGGNGRPAAPPLSTTPLILMMTLVGWVALVFSPPPWARLSVMWALSTTGGRTGGGSGLICGTCSRCSAAPLL